MLGYLHLQENEGPLGQPKSPGLHGEEPLGGNGFIQPKYQQARVAVSLALCIVFCMCEPALLCQCLLSVGSLVIYILLYRGLHLSPQYLKTF